MSALAYAGISSVDQQHKKPLCHPWLRGWAKPCHNSYHRHTAVAYLMKVWMYSEVPQLGTSCKRELKGSGWKESPELHPGLDEAQGHIICTLQECDMWWHDIMSHRMCFTQLSVLGLSPAPWALRELKKIIFWRNKPETILRQTSFSNVEFNYNVSVRVTCYLLKVRLYKCYLLLKLA